MVFSWGKQTNRPGSSFCSRPVELLEGHFRRVNMSVNAASSSNAASTTITM